MSTDDISWDSIDDTILLEAEGNFGNDGDNAIARHSPKENAARKRSSSFDEKYSNVIGQSPKKKQAVVENAVDSAEETRAPLYEMRRGYLWVSDLLSQAWCEQQMVYNMTAPTVAIHNPIIGAGSDLHLARELQVQDVVQVKITSSEDIFAVKVINLCQVAENFLNGVPLRREIPVFGAPYDDVFLVGMIDEIRCDQDNFTLDLLEFKTRHHKSFPSKAQALTHQLQVMIYKKLFDDLVTGKTSKQVIVKHLPLDLNKTLGEDVMKHIKCAGVNERSTLDRLLDLFYERMALLPRIGQCFIEYCHQQDSSTIGIKKVENDTKMLQEKVQFYVQYWKGQRKECGVDIEDAWKCQRCDFADVCDWRARKAQEYAQKNSANSQGD